MTEEQRLAAKLADTGLTDEDAAAWVREVIDAALADERSRIAAAIEALNVSPNAAGDYQRGWEIVRGIAARIARQGGVADAASKASNGSRDE